MHLCRLMNKTSDGWFMVWFGFCGTFACLPLVAGWLTTRGEKCQIIVCVFVRVCVCFCSKSEARQKKKKINAKMSNKSTPQRSCEGFSSGVFLNWVTKDELDLFSFFRLNLFNHRKNKTNYILILSAGGLAWFPGLSYLYSGLWREGWGVGGGSPEMRRGKECAGMRGGLGAPSPQTTGWPWGEDNPASPHGPPPPHPSSHDLLAFQATERWKPGRSPELGWRRLIVTAARLKV